MDIQSGGVYWVRPVSAPDEALRIPHPHVVIRLDGEGRSDGTRSATVCAITTNARKVSLPGNVRLEAGEANLPRASVVEVSKVLTIDTTRLGDYIGTLSARRVDQILAGMRLQQRSFFDR